MHELQLSWGNVLCPLAPKIQGSKETSWPVCHLRSLFLMHKVKTGSSPHMFDHIEHLLKYKFPGPSMGLSPSVCLEGLGIYIVNKCSRWFL